MHSNVAFVHTSYVKDGGVEAYGLNRLSMSEIIVQRNATSLSVCKQSVI